MRLYLFIIFIILLYLYGYFVFPKNISILQTSLQEFDFSLLLMKQPIVIEDCVKDIVAVLKLWFSTNIIRDTTFNQKHVWNINSFKYLFVYAIDDLEMYLYPPRHKIVADIPNSADPILAIKVKRHQSIIIPYRWKYNLKNIDSVKMYGVHDYATYALDIIV